MSKKRILIVEDEAAVVLDLEGTLARLGYEVAGVCATGEDAVAFAASLTPDLVLMDIRLAGPMDGIEAAAAIRAQDGAPIVFLTAQGDKQTLARARVSEPYAYVLKPFDERELHISIDVALFRQDSQNKLARHSAELEQLVAKRTEALSKKSRELELAANVKSDFLRAVSHELRTPLNHIIGFADLLADPTLVASAATQRSYAASILDSGHRLAKLVGDLLALASLEENTLALSRAPVALGELLHATAELFAAARSQGITLSVDVAPIADRVLQVDAAKLGHALAQLVCNAIKVTPPGGHVSVRASSPSSEADVEVIVSDTGPGIAEDRVATLFEPFSKPGIGTGAADGLGVGLAVAHRLIGLHGARLWVRSRVGQGSTFGFTLPPGGST